MWQRHETRAPIKPKTSRSLSKKAIHGMMPVGHCPKITVRAKRHQSARLVMKLSGPDTHNLILIRIHFN